MDDSSRRLRLQGRLSDNQWILHHLRIRIGRLLRWKLDKVQPAAPVFRSPGGKISGCLQRSISTDPNSICRRSAKVLKGNCQAPLAVHHVGPTFGSVRLRTGDHERREWIRMTAQHLPGGIRPIRLGP